MAVFYTIWPLSTIRVYRDPPGLSYPVLLSIFPTEKSFVIGPCRVRLGKKGRKKCYDLPGTQDLPVNPRQSGKSTIDVFYPRIDVFYPRLRVCSAYRGYRGAFGTSL